MDEKKEQDKLEYLEKLRIKSKESSTEKIKNILSYTGLVLTITTGVAYLALVYILVEGFKVSVDSNKLLMFVILGAVAGLLMSMSMRTQGPALAKKLPTTQKILDEYATQLGQSEKKLRPIGFYLISSAIKDIFTKGVTTVVSLYFSISFIVEGIGDPKYFWLGVINVLLFLGIGFMGLAKSYDYYIENHIPYLQQKIEKMKEEKQNELLRKNQDNDRGRDGADRGPNTDQDVIKSAIEFGGSGNGNLNAGGQSPEIERGLYQSGEINADQSERIR